MGRDLFDIALMKKFGGGSGNTSSDSPSGGGGVTSWEDIPDKPFNIVELMPETQFMYNPDWGYFAAQTGFEFVAGKTYIISWNGVEYTATAKVYYYPDNFKLAIGNEAVIGGEDNGLPFVMLSFLFDSVTKGIMFAAPLDGSTAVSVGVKGVESSPLYDNSNTLVLDARGWYDDTSERKFELNALYATPEQIHTALVAGKKVSMLVPVFKQWEDGMVDMVGMEEVPLLGVAITEGKHVAYWYKAGTFVSKEYMYITMYNDDGTYISVGS